MIEQSIPRRVAAFQMPPPRLDQNPIRFQFHSGAITSRSKAYSAAESNDRSTPDQPSAKKPTSVAVAQPDREGKKAMATVFWKENCRAWKQCRRNGEKEEEGRAVVGAGLGIKCILDLGLERS